MAPGMAANILLLANIAIASSFVLPLFDQTTRPALSPSSEFTCDLPPILDPAGDGLPSAASLFSSREALERQVKRHRAIVQVPSVSYDDLGEISEDERWAPFYNLYPVLEKTYPTL